jgi:hypothetical protein
MMLILELLTDDAVDWAQCGGWPLLHVVWTGWSCWLCHVSFSTSTLSLVQFTKNVTPLFGTKDMQDAE